MEPSTATAQAIASGEQSVVNTILQGGSSAKIIQTADFVNSFVGASVVILTALATLTVSVMLYSLLLKLKYKEANRMDVLAFLGSLSLMFCSLYVWNLAGVVFRLFFTSDTALFMIFVSAIIFNALIAFVYLMKGAKDITFRLRSIISNIRSSRKKNK